MSLIDRLYRCYWVWRCKREAKSLQRRLDRNLPREMHRLARIIREVADAMNEGGDDD